LLLSDEGVGVHAARALAKEQLPDDVTVIDVGTCILDVITDIEETERVIVVDAVMGDNAPGTIYRFLLDESEEKSCFASMHGFDIHRVVALSRRTTMPTVVVIGMEPESITWSLELSSIVQKRIPLLLQTIRLEI